jgi:hypothetical protein
MTRDEARAWYISVLLDHIREDPYPSATQMSMVEAALERVPQLIPAYVEVLIEKVGDDRFPSTDMLKRIASMTETIPAQ